MTPKPISRHWLVGERLPGAASIVPRALTNWKLITMISGTTSDFNPRAGAHPRTESQIGRGPPRQQKHFGERSALKSVLIAVIAHLKYVFCLQFAPVAKAYGAHFR